MQTERDLVNTLSATDVNEDMASRRRNLGLRSQHREESEKSTDACRDEIDENIDEDDVDVITPVHPVNPTVSMRQRSKSPSTLHALGRGDQRENSENMAKTVYGAVKGGIQEMSQT